MKNILFKVKLKESDNAVVGIVVTVLLIGLLLSVMVMINTMYVPQWLENSEAAHMKETSNQFTQLKYALDLQTIVNDSTAMTTPITLGTKDIPFFNRGRTFDSLEIFDEAITIDFTPGKSYISDTIKFSSGNSYFVDQSYIYEAGALIISQDEKSVVYGLPPIVITEYGNNITFYITEIVGLPGKPGASGYGTYPIFTKAKNPTNNVVINNVESITITTKYPYAWKTIFEQTIETPEFDYYIEIPPTSDEITINFDIEENSNNITIYNKEIDTQIAFGLAD